MKSVIIKTSIAGTPVQVKVTEKTNFKVLKEVLRDNLVPIVGNQNWGKIIETIRDTALPHLQ